MFKNEKYKYMFKDEEYSSFLLYKFYAPVSSFKDNSDIRIELNLTKLNSSNE